jgi:transketolase
MGGGFEYGPAGHSHHGLEDLAVMRVQPGMTVVAPADHTQVPAALRATWDLPGPVYYRLGKDDVTSVPGVGGHFELGRLQELREGQDVVFIVTGAIAAEVVAASEVLASGGIETRVLLVASLQPPPEHDLVGALRLAPLVLTVEAHYVTGGLGSLVAETIAEHGLRCRLVRCGVRNTHERTGSAAYLAGIHGLLAEQLAETARSELRRPRGRREPA